MEQINEAWRNSALNETHENMPERTFFNHRDAISQIFGLDIKFDRELGYHISAAQMGVGGDDTWGALVHPEYLLDTSDKLTLDFSFRGVTL